MFQDDLISKITGIDSVNCGSGIYWFLPTKLVYRWTNRSSPRYYMIHRKDVVEIALNVHADSSTITMTTIHGHGLGDGFWCEKEALTLTDMLLRWVLVEPKCSPLKPIMHIVPLEGDPCPNE